MLHIKLHSSTNFHCIFFAFLTNAVSIFAYFLHIIGYTCTFLAYICILPAYLSRFLADFVHIFCMFD